MYTLQFFNISIDCTQNDNTNLTAGHLKFNLRLSKGDNWRQFQSAVFVCL